MCKHCWDDTESVHHKDFIRGWEEPDGFEKEVNYRPKPKKRKATRTRPGCPGNDNKTHVYVFTTEYNIKDLFYRYFGFHKYEKRFCAGCGKNGHKVRKTERYVKKFKDSSRYGSPEYRHEGFREYRQKWLTQRGYTREVYGNGW